MYKTISLWDFREAFRRADRGDQFSYDGLGAIYQYIVDLEDDTGQQTELDVIAICCDWVEAHWSEIASMYGIDIASCVAEDARIGEVEAYLSDHAQYVEVSAGHFVFMSDF